MKNKFASAGIMLASFLMFASSAFAQDETMEDDFDSFDESELFEEIPSVFAASKYEQKITEAPASITIITAEEIKKYGYREFSDVLNSVRGFFVTYDRSYDYVNVRGVGVPGDYNSRILVMIDGQRVNENVYDAAGVGGDFLIDLELIERVEIVRGPGSSLYGTSAVLGVVNVISKRGRDYQGLQTSLEYGSFDRKKVQLSYGNKLENGLEFLLGASKMSSEGDDALFFPEFDDPETNNGVFENADNEDYSRLFANLAFGDFNVQAVMQKREKFIPTASYETQFNDQDTRTLDDHNYINLSYQHAFDKTDVSARIAYDEYKYEGHYIYDYADYDADPFAEPDLTDFEDYATGNWITAELQAIRSYGKHRLTFGGEYRDNTKVDQSTFDPYDVYLDDQQSNTVKAIYVQDEYALNDKFIVNLGLRHDDYDTFGTTTNPRLALIYNPSETSSFKFLHGEAFRAPNAFELYYNDNGFTSKAASGLEPETITSNEFVYEQKLNERFRLVANAYQNTIENSIQYVTDPADDLLVFVNGGELDVKGLELELEGKWDQGRTVSFNYAHTNAEDALTGERLTNSAKSVAKLNVLTPVYGEKLFAGFQLLHLGKRITTQGGWVDAYTIANMNLTADNVYSGLDLSLGIYNMFDETYADSGGEEHLQDVITQDGRNFRLKLSYQF